MGFPVLSFLIGIVSLHHCSGQSLCVYWMYSFLWGLLIILLLMGSLRSLTGSLRIICTILLLLQGRIGISTYVWQSIAITALLVPAPALHHFYYLMVLHLFFPPEDTPVTLSSFLSGARELILQASSHLQQVQQRYQASVDRHRRHVEFHVGDMVYLRLRFAHHHFIQGHASTEKLAPRYYGPYCILEVLSPVTYRLQLPASTRACDIFHVSLLRAAIEDDAPRDAEFPTAPDLFPLLPAAILQVRLHHSRRRRQIQFLVQWDGRPVEEATWEPIDVFYHTPSLADQARALAALVDSSTSAVAPVVTTPDAVPVDPPGLAVT
ncbi:hypothetical protein O6H91_Y428800 [Diphasiastrum complanatum]|nr:hypothetical protein O6H91_Y428800 [Diphasiastrum complanatum]